MALGTSGIPGPSSRATIMMPFRPAFWARLSRISPVLAYSRMLRASSEMAVAITVKSLPSKPNRAARARPSWRAATMSAADRMGTVITDRPMSSPGPASSALGMRRAGVLQVVEVGEPLLEVEGGGDVLKGEAELDHGKGHLGLDSHDHGLGAPQPDHVGDGPQRANGEGIHHVKDGNVHDGSPGSIAAHLLHEVVTELEQVLIAEGRLNGSDEVVSLFEDRYPHGVGSGPRSFRCRRFSGHDHLVAEQAFGFLDTSLQVAHGVDLPKIHADGDQGLGDLGGETGHDDVRTHQPGGIHGLDQVVGHRSVYGRHARDVHHHDLRAVGPDAPEELLRELPRALGVDDTNDGQDEKAVANLEDGRGELANGLLLLADDALAL